MKSAVNAKKRKERNDQNEADQENEVEVRNDPEVENEGKSFMKKKRNEVLSSFLAKAEKDPLIYM